MIAAALDAAHSQVTFAKGAGTLSWNGV